MSEITLGQIEVNFGRLKTALSMKVALRGLTDSVPRRLAKVIHESVVDAEHARQANVTQGIEDELTRSRDKRSGSELYTQQKELVYLLTVLSNLDVPNRDDRARKALLPVIKNRYQAIQDRNVRRIIDTEIDKLLFDGRPEVREVASQIRDEAVTASEVDRILDFSAPVAARKEVLRRMIAHAQLSQFLPQLEVFLQQLAEYQNPRNTGIQSEFRELGKTFEEYISAIGRVLAENSEAHSYVPKLLERILNGDLVCAGPWLTLAMEFREAGLDYIIQANRMRQLSPEKLKRVWPLVIGQARLQNRRAVDFMAKIAREDSDLGDDAMLKLASFNLRPFVTPYLDHKLSELRTHYKSERMWRRLSLLDEKRPPQTEDLEPIVDRQLNEDQIEPAAYKRLGANRHATLNVYLRRFRGKLSLPQVRRAIPYVKKLIEALNSASRTRAGADRLSSDWGPVLADVLMVLLRESEETFPAEAAKDVVRILVGLRFPLDHKNPEVVNAGAEPHAEFQRFLHDHWSQLFKTPAQIRRIRNIGERG